MLNNIPQMAPMMWMLLFIVSVTFINLVNSKVYFLFAINKKSEYKNNSFLKNKMQMSW